MAKKSFREKLQGDGYPKVSPIPAKMQPRLGAGTLVVPAPWEVDDLIRKVHKGKVTTATELRAALALKHGTDHACAIVTGIAVRVVAGAAEEDRADGRTRVTPYWRALKAKGELNEKLPGGAVAQREALEAEGHDVEQRGKRWFVANYECSLKSSW